MPKKYGTIQKKIVWRLLMDRYLSLKDHVYNYISERINTGTIKPDDKINESQVSEELHISRTPVREALIQLASDGYLDNLPRKGFRVKYLNVKKAKDLYEVIGTLDGRAAVMCIHLLEDSDLAKMEFLIKSMDVAIESGLSNKYYELQMEFHNVYLDLCPNKEITDLLNKLKNNFIRKYYVFENPDNEFAILRETNEQHYEMLRLFQEENAEELERFIRDVHWDSSKAQFDSLLK